jgi:hypothetical protein
MILEALEYALPVDCNGVFWKLEKLIALNQIELCLSLHTLASSRTFSGCRILSLNCTRLHIYLLTTIPSC